MIHQTLLKWGSLLCLSLMRSGSLSRSILRNRVTILAQFSMSLKRIRESASDPSELLLQFACSSCSTSSPLRRTQVRQQFWKVLSSRWWRTLKIRQWESYTWPTSNTCLTRSNLFPWDWSLTPLWSQTKFKTLSSFRLLTTTSSHFWPGTLSWLFRMPFRCWTCSQDST